MKNRNGFTLIELLAVITILGLIITIAVPAITNLVNESRANTFSINEDNLIEAAKGYIAGETTALPLNAGDEIEIEYADMKTLGYVDIIYDPQDKTECDGSVIVQKATSYRYAYIADIDCATMESTTIVLNGPHEVSLVINTAYTDAYQAYALDNAAVLLTADTTALDNTIAGEYDITYSTATNSTTRKIIVYSP